MPVRLRKMMQDGTDDRIYRDGCNYRNFCWPLTSAHMCSNQLAAQKVNMSKSTNEPVHSW